MRHSIVSLEQTADIWRRHCIDQHPLRTHILDLVSGFSTYGCTDARDRIFAVHALSQDENAHTEINYTLGVHTTYRNFAVACMNDGRTLDVLIAASARVDILSTEPQSWVPDWRIQPIIEDSFRPEYHYYTHQGEPMVNLSGDVRGRVVQFAFKSFWSYTHSAQYPLRVAEREHLSMNQPLLEYIRAIDSLYVRCSRPSEMHQKSLWTLLCFFWGVGPSSLNRAQLTALLECLTARRSTNESDYANCIAQHEKLLAEPITAASKGRCFFEARFADSEAPVLCYGSVGIQGGDILLPLTEVAPKFAVDVPLTPCVYRMCVLRPWNCSSEQNNTAVSKASWTDWQYRVVGEAWLSYPFYDASLTRNPISPTSKVTLC